MWQALKRFFTGEEKETPKPETWEPTEIVKQDSEHVNVAPTRKPIKERRQSSRPRRKD